jgi:hypothetical protein
MQTATAATAWALECLTGEEVELVWWTDLADVEHRRHADAYPQSVAIDRWAQADERLQAVVKQHTVEGREAVGLVTVVGTQPKGTPLDYKPYAVTYATPQRVDVALAASHPPLGRWYLLTQSGAGVWKQDALPRTFFVDGIPF